MSDAWLLLSRWAASRSAPPPSRSPSPARSGCPSSSRRVLRWRRPTRPLDLDADEADGSTVDVPTTELFDSELLSNEDRSEYMGREQVIAECMAEQGVEYLPAAPWLNQDAQPRGLSFEQSIMWLNAFYGEAREDWSVPASDWRRRGCLGVGDHAVAAARAAGTPLSAPVPEPDPNALTEEEELALFHEAIESCMADKGFGAFDDGTRCLVGRHVRRRGHRCRVPLGGRGMLGLRNPRHGQRQHALTARPRMMLEPRSTRSPVPAAVSSSSAPRRASRGCRWDRARR